MPTTMDYRYENEDNDNSWDTWEAMLEWRDIWLKAIALAWTNAEFKKLLLEDSRRAFEEYFAYKLPQTLDFQVIDVANQKEVVTFTYPPAGMAPSKSGFGWYAVQRGKSGKKRHITKIESAAEYNDLLRKTPDLVTEWALPRNLLVYPLPPPPDVDIRAVAVSDFSAAGRTYPFTTC